MLEEYDNGNCNESTDMRRTHLNSVFVSPQEYLELKNQLEDKIRKLSELESILSTANMRFETEFKRTTHLTAENKKIK
jgi:predicted metal-binding transcription factor (methanogenesis marker protein 9)